MQKRSLFFTLRQILKKIESYSNIEMRYTERSDPLASNGLYGYIDLFRYRIIAKYVKRVNTLIDVGSGLGYGTLLLDNALNSDLSIGIDISGDASKYAQKRYGGETICFVKCNAIHLPFKDKSFDLITCLEMIEHARCPSKVLQEMHRILKDEGRLVISTPNNMLVRLLTQKNEPMNPFHEIEFSISEFKELLSEEDFNVLHTIGFYIPIPIFRKYERVRNSKFYSIFSCHAFSFLPWVCFYQLHIAHIKKK